MHSLDTAESRWRSLRCLRPQQDSLNLFLNDASVSVMTQNELDYARDNAYIYSYLELINTNLFFHNWKHSTYLRNRLYEGSADGHMNSMNFILLVCPSFLLFSFSKTTGLRNGRIYAASLSISITASKQRFPRCFGKVIWSTCPDFKPFVSSYGRGPRSFELKVDSRATLKRRSWTWCVKSCCL